MKKIILMMMMVIALLGITACGSSKEAAPAPAAKPATAVFETNMGNFEIKLATDYAPKTSENFITLVNNMKDTLSQIDPYLVYSWEKMKVLYILMLLGPVIIAVVVIVALAALPKSSSRLSVLLALMLAYLVLVIVSAVCLLKNLSATSDALIREASTIRQMIRKAEKKQQ